MSRFLHFVTIGLQAILWAGLLGFVALVALPRFTQYDVLVVRGGSMEPAIHLGSVVVIDRKAIVPGIGSIVSFREPNGDIVTHRIVAMDRGRYVTHGDANRSPDAEERTAQQIVGSVVFSIPFAGYLVHLLQQPYAFFVLLLGTGGYLIFGEVQTIGREISRMREGRATRNV